MSDEAEGSIDWNLVEGAVTLRSCKDLWKFSLNGLDGIR